ncbi:MAG TPA: electron transfer flavoprotein subunit alpha/FixB family protein [Gemmatimonadota bacterium]|nr:electron transfer flavoprotein subunit alpha/FixB family protein [Gemmatimonadota bacterium]
MATILAVAESRAGELRPVSREVVATARRLADELGAEVEALVLGAPGVQGGATALAEAGADRILVAEDEAFGLYAPDAAVRAVQERCEATECVVVLFAATAQGKDLSARCAARLGRSLATEVTEVAIDGGVPVVVRPQYAGKAYARIRMPSAPALISLRPNVFAAGGVSAGRGEVEALALDAGMPRTRVTAFETGERERLDVAEASIVVSGGRGMQGPENWKLLEDLVDALGPKATLGASRAVVDAGWRPHGEQVGQTGKVVSPGLYFAVGISGAIQHLAGMRTAGVIVAINRDPEAPIFNVANYGLVGDAFEIVPKLAEEIRAIRS